MREVRNIGAIAAIMIGWLVPAISAAADIVPPDAYVMTPGGVSLADGSLTFSDVDLTIGTLKLERFLLGGRMDPNVPYFGPRMSHNFDIYVARNQRTDCSGGPATCTTYRKPIVHFGLSASGTFYESLPPYPTILYATDDATAGTLEFNASGAFVYTDQDGTVYTFSTTVGAAGATNSKRIANIVFPDGRRQDFSYNGSGQLKAVLDSNGYAIVFDYNGAGNVSVACGYNRADTYVSVTSACAGASLKVSYGYSTGSTPVLTSVTDARGNVTTYTYVSDRIACIKPPGYSVCKITNTYGGFGASSGGTWQVTKQVFSDGATWKFQYLGDYTKARDPDIYTEVEPSHETIVTDPLGKVTQYTFVNSSPYEAIGPDGKVTSYRYGGGFDYWSSPPGGPVNYGKALMSATLPEGNRYLVAYGGRRQIARQTWQAKPGSGLADLVKDYGFPYDCTTAPSTPQNCAKPLWIKDFKGNQTDFTYTSFGGVISEMQPAPTSGAARPLKLYTYVQRDAYVKNSGGSLVSTGVATWFVDTVTQCQTAAGSSVAICDASAPRLQMSYEYGPPGTASALILRGMVVTDLATGTSQRTCYGTDWRGRRISSTPPRAGLAVCP